ncbi:MAG: DUF4923 family protein [Prevotellaceae bacterium]|nr:DUF4923 family protein [Prevotellaceae bacterium]
MKTFIASIVMLLTATAANAQLSDILSKAKDALGKAAGSNSTVATVVDNIIGTSKVKDTDLVGTWKYSQPAVAFESESALSKVGGTAASAKIENNLQTYFTKFGITKGACTITFAKDGTFSTVVKGKTVKGVYTVNGSTITFAKSATAKTKITANVKLGATLQITFKADKLLAFIQQFGSIAGAASSTLNTISTLAKNYNGMQVGMRFTK